MLVKSADGDGGSSGARRAIDAGGGKRKRALARFRPEKFLRSFCRTLRRPPRTPEENSLSVNIFSQVIRHDFSTKKKRPERHFFLVRFGIALLVLGTSHAPAAPVPTLFSSMNHAAKFRTRHGPNPHESTTARRQSQVNQLGQATTTTPASNIVAQSVPRQFVMRMNESGCAPVNGEDRNWRRRWRAVYAGGRGSNRISVCSLRRLRRKIPCKTAIGKSGRASRRRSRPQVNIDTYQRWFAGITLMQRGRAADDPARAE